MNELLGNKILDNEIQSILWFAGVILVAFIFKRYISRLIGSLLYRLFKRYSKENRGKLFNDLLAPPIQWLIFLLIITSGTNALNYPSAWNVHIFDTHLHIILTGALKLATIFAFTWLILRGADFISVVLKERHGDDGQKVDSQLAPFITDSLKIIVVILSIFFILGAVFRLNVASLIAGLGVGGLAVALAAQESLKNLLGSLTIFLDKPFSVGDTITAGSVTGTVEKVGFRSTRIRTANKTYLTLPNKVMVESSVDNLTLRNSQSVSANITLAYDTRAEQVKAIVKGIGDFLRSSPIQFSDVVINFDSFTDNGFKISIAYFIIEMDWGKYIAIKEQVNFKIVELVHQQGASFAKQARVVEMKNDKQ